MNSLACEKRIWRLCGGWNYDRKIWLGEESIRHSEW